jgi:hypothetical protein
MPGGLLRVPRLAALAAIAALVAAASLTSFAESYRGLYLWARHHGLDGPWAAIWPLQVDVFIAVGELALFVALADGWARRSRTGAWLVTLAGLGVSVAGNVGHATGDAASRGTAAVPPLSAAAALAVGLGVLKRVVQAHSERTRTRRESAPAAHSHAAPGEHPRAAPAPEPRPAGRAHPRPPGERTRTAPVNGADAEREFAPELAAGTLPSLRQIRARLHVGQDRARTLRTHLETVTAHTGPADSPAAA